MRMEQLLVVYLLLLLGPVSSLNSDGLSLLSFKKSIFSDPGKSMADWDDSDATPCRWSGILCSSIRGESEPRVASLSLPKKELVGSISPDLGSLPYLQHINLRSNQLISSIPPAIFNATSLQSLILSDNDLSGVVPDSVSRASGSLNVLDLAGNGFSGPIPASITSCGNLRTLILSGNRFSGEIPRGISKLASLTKLDLSSNSLIGSIPAELGELLQLEGTLNLSSNNLSGEIPSSLGHLPITVGIDLSFNDLSGPIPLNGTLSNQGPTAFLGNPGLCGLPLKVKCSPTSTISQQPGTMPDLGPSFRPPGSSSSSPISNSTKIKSRSGLSSEQVIAIAVGDSVGVLLIVLAVGYCFYCRGGGKSEKSSKISLCGFSAVQDEENSDADEHPGAAAIHNGLYRGGGGELLHFDEESEKLFDLDDLLRASAYVLGKGNSGIVYKAVMEGGASVVVRRLELGGGDSSKKMAKELESEVKAIGSIRHPNVVPLRAYYCGMNEKLLIYDFLPGGSLATALEQHQQHWLMIQEVSSSHTAPSGDKPEIHPACLSWPQRLSIARDLARGLAFLHEGAATKRNSHGNVKPSNILLDANRTACISEFGIGRLSEILACHDTISSTSSLRSSDVAPGNRSSRSIVDPAAAVDLPDASTALVSGSSSSLSMYNATNSIYRPPEALPGVRPTQKWDVYSFGLIVLELLTGSASAQLAGSDVDLALAVRRMLVSASVVVEGDSKEALMGSGSGGVGFPAATMLMAGIRAEAEAMELLQLALKCASVSPDHRPKMKHVVEVINKIAPGD